ncbi:DUF2304 domain-containing protein [Blautia glucerasea]|jgi:hypothetical protein|uniref:DUF2304 domain-containing protein n=1 Tax=Blautia TaxID=572511 RepID=UPI001D026317|nr:DUF2304 domain-containing protein [Blautia glucerasea]MCB5386588.1 DUF2304 domain-containing protein [Blautia glucerasea]MCB5420943.1 DUF2304 domain-containing protein [Blautia luti]
MSIALRVLLIIVSVMNTLNILRRIRKSKLQIDYSIFWLVFSMILIVIAVFPQIVIKLAQIIGFQSPANMVFLLVIFALMFKSFQSTLEISQLQYKIEELTQKIALEEHKE